MTTRQLHLYPIGEDYWDCDLIELYDTEIERDVYELQRLMCAVWQVLVNIEYRNAVDIIRNDMLQTKDLPKKDLN